MFMLGISFLKEIPSINMSLISFEIQISPPRKHIQFDNDTGYV